MKIAAAAIVLALASASVAQVIPDDGVGLLISGYQGGVSLEVVTEDAFCNNLGANQVLPNLPAGQIEGGSSEFVDGMVWSCCGSNTNQYSDCYTLTLGDEQWQSAGGANYEREYGASFVFNGEMMLLGGYNDRNGWTDIVEKKQAGSQTWDIMTDWTMPRKLFDHCAAQMDETHIIVAGGNEAVNEYTTAVSILDTVTGEWMDAEPMPVGRAQHDCIVGEYMNETGLFVTGGCSEFCTIHLDDTRFFSFDTMEWTTLPALNEIRDRHKMTYIGGQVAVVGGAVPSGPVGSVEVFDGEKWVARSENLEFPRSSFGMPKYLPRSELDCA